MELIRRSERWLAGEVDDEIVMLDLERGTYIGLNPMGARIWELIADPMSIDTLCTRLISEFDVDALTCRREVESFIETMAHEGMISRTG